MKIKGAVTSKDRAQLSFVRRLVADGLRPIGPPLLMLATLARLFVQDFRPAGEDAARASVDLTKSFGQLDYGAPGIGNHGNADVVQRRHAPVWRGQLESPAF
jgi:hypothetical protein